MSLWRPPCPCDAACLPSEVDTVGPLRLAARLCAAAGVLLMAALRPSQAQRWARAMLRALGIRWSVLGAPILPGALLAGNHVSWLDIILLMSTSKGARLVAKAEVGRWPVVGALARSCGAIFVDRSRPRSLPETVGVVTRALLDGDSVQVFPEGTTTCGAHPQRWRPAFLQAAIDARAPVQRFTLLFSSASAAFVADESLLTSLRRVAGARNLSVVMLIDPPRPAHGPRRDLARRMSPRRSASPLRSASPTAAAGPPARHLPLRVDHELRSVIDRRGAA